MIWFHRTTPDRLTRILPEGLKVDSKASLTLDGRWAHEIYGVRPVFLSSAAQATYSREAPVLLEVDVHGLALVADLPSMVDAGACYDVEDDAMWFAAGPEMSFPDLLTTGSAACLQAIARTGTAACLVDIPAERISLAFRPNPVKTAGFFSQPR